MTMHRIVTGATALVLLSATMSGDFRPREDVSACVLWLDAADVDGDGKVDDVQDGVHVATWTDKSGQGHTAEQASADYQPAVAKEGLAGKPVLSFDGNDVLKNSLVQDWSGESWSISVVASLDADTPNNWRGIIGNRFGKGSAKWWTLGTKSDGTTYLELGAGQGVSSNLAPANSRAYVYTIVKQGSEFTLLRNGALVGTTKIEAVGDRSNELYIGRWFGAGQEWKGGIAEILVYDRALSPSEREGVERYLAEKWDVFFPAHTYTRKDTWAETMLATRAALSDAEREGQHAYQQEEVQELWDCVRRDFPVESGRMLRDVAAVYGEAEAGRDAHLAWFRAADNTEVEQMLTALGGVVAADDLAALKTASAGADDPRWLQLYARTAEIRDAFVAAENRLASLDLPALRRAINDLTTTYPEQYGVGAGFAARLDAIEARLDGLRDGLRNCDAAALNAVDAIEQFRREALLANPLLGFDKLLLVKRSAGSPSLGLPQNWQSNCILPRKGFDNEIEVLSLKELDKGPQTLYRPEESVFVGDMDLNFDADRLLFSSVNENFLWQIYEMKIDGSGLRQVTPGDQPDVDSYDACYLPDGHIMFSSNAYMASVPCVNGGARTAVLYRMNPDGTGIRQLCFDQEHNWCPTMLPNGRVMYLRWEYTDTPHSHDRVLFHMNPDGTGQMEYYGSNSYWPNSLFYARPLPGQPTKFAGIVSGHHGVPRMGELVVFDAAEGRRESSGAIQRIPGYGKGVHSVTDDKYDSSLIVDNLVDASWPKYLHPYPLSDKYFLVACKPTPEALWGIYLVDVFDNMVLLKEEPGYALLEPVPIQKTTRPPVIPDRVNLAEKEATVYLTDVYAGQGLKDVPRGTIKQLRVFTYHFLYPKMGGPQAVVGMEGPWDIKRIMGTVPVCDDGSAYFRVPANTPISVQPLDAEGKAVQLMRSWFTGMPGEVLSCVGCHESQSSTAPVKPTIAARQAPADITPWYGPERGFNFEREVQPVLDKYCVSCHNGSDNARKGAPDFKTRDHITDYTSVFHNGGKDAAHFSQSYANIHKYVRRPGLESDYHLLMPMEFHADTTQLVQKLKKGHHGVKLDAEAWDRLITWIDLNAPYHGTWTEIAGEDRVNHWAERRRDLLKLYADMDTDPEAIPETPGYDATPVAPEPIQARSETVDCPGWPFDTNEAKLRQNLALDALGGPVKQVVNATEDLAQTASDAPYQRTFDLGGGVTLNMVLVPTGGFVMGDANGPMDETPLTRVTVTEPFWMGQFEITNQQFELFDPSHDSRVEHRFSMQFGVRGFYVNGPGQPVVRVSWEDAMAFCDWLSEKTGESFSLPTEAQWEYACRAGAATPFFFGEADADWSPYANLADEKLREFVCHTYKKEREPWLHASKYDDWIPKDTRFNDGGFLSDGIGNYQPNAWGLHDMHGNVWEWTRTAYRPYPYDETDGRNNVDAAGERVVRGGSWRDRPERAGAAFRLGYRPYQGVYNVGFRVTCAAKPTAKVAAAE